MDFLIDLENLETFVQENESYLLENWVKIAQSDIPGVSICVTSDVISGLNVSIFDNGSIRESWGNIEDYKDLLDWVEDASDMVMEEELLGRNISADLITSKVNTLLEELGISEDFWDDIVNDLCSTLGFYGYEIK